MKILVFIDHMASGGAARVTSIMCNGLSSKGYDVVLAFDRQRPMLYGCGDNITIIDNHVARKGKSHLAGIVQMSERIRKYHQIINYTHPDIIIGVEPEPYLCARMASLCKSVHVIAADHTSYSHRQHWFTHWIRWHAYKWADCVSILSHTDEQILKNKIPNKVVIYNPISFPVYDGNIKREKIVLCVGRKDAWQIKGFDRMIRIWESISSSNPEWKLVIAGIDGVPPLSSILYAGQIKNMQDLYQRAAIFALPSRVEGFPMCLLEAASQGCACISYELGGIISEIYVSPEEGIIVSDNDDDMFAQKLNEMINSPEYQQKCSYNIRNRMNEFSQEKFISSWDSLIKSLLPYEHC